MADEHMIFTSQPHRSALCHHLNQQRLGDQFCDLQLVVRGEVFPAHSSVLRAASPILMRTLAPYATAGVSRELLLRGLSGEACDDLLTLLYTGRLRAPPARFRAVMEYARHLEVPLATEFEYAAAAADGPREPTVGRPRGNRSGDGRAPAAEPAAAGDAADSPRGGVSWRRIDVPPRERSFTLYRCRESAAIGGRGATGAGERLPRAVLAAAKTGTRRAAAAAEQARLRQERYDRRSDVGLASGRAELSAEPPPKKGAGASAARRRALPKPAAVERPRPDEDGVFAGDGDAAVEGRFGATLPTHGGGARGRTAGPGGRRFARGDAGGGSGGGLDAGRAGGGGGGVHGGGVHGGGVHGVTVTGGGITVTGGGSNTASGVAAPPEAVAFGGRRTSDGVHVRDRSSCGDL